MRRLLLLVPLAALGWWAAPARIHSLGASSVANTRMVTTADLGASLDGWRTLYAEQGLLSREETARLKARREAEAEALQAEIGAGGAAAARWALDAFRDASGSRERLLLVGGLGRNSSEEAVTALVAVYAEADSARIEEEALRALGRSEGEGATEALVDALDEGDERTRQVAAQSLTGHAEALEPLREIASDPSEAMNVRLEAIPAIGGMRSSEGRAALESLANDPAVEARVRQFAARELARSAS